jgi:polysaccharide chain length determinant protein (PEP-CTERM system associated)
MLPGKTYRPEDYVEILWRRKWIWILPFVVVTTGTVIGTQFLPDRYRAEARIQIVPQQVPETFVQPTVTTSLDARLQAMSQVIQSRTRLEGIIQELNLYEKERQELIMEDVIEQMRANISVQIPRTRGTQPGSFTVGFVAEDARSALQVTERLATQFISESLQDRTVQADQTSQFLDTQLEEARRKLAEHEQKFAEYRRRYAGELPTQVSSTLGLVQSTQTQLQILADTINRDRDRQLVLERTIADQVAISAAREQPVPARGGAGESAAARLEGARAALRALQQRLKPEHPDMVRAERVVRDLEEKAAAEELNEPVGTGVVNASSNMPAADLTRLSAMQAEHESLGRRIALNQAEEARLQKVLPGLRAKVEVAPSREAEATELMRDYDSLDEQYRTLLGRAQQSRIAADLERRQIGEQFRLIDPARLPMRPFSPDRTRLNMMGAMGGLLFGLALIALIEYRDTSFRTEDDFTASLALPVLAVIPAMLTRPERQRAKRRRLVTVSASVVVMAGAIAVIVWKMDAIANWVR